MTVSEVGDDEGIARIDMNLGDLSYDRNDHDAGIHHSQAALARFHAMGNTWDLVDCLDFLGANLTGAERTVDAVRIFGASQALRDAIGAVRSHRDQSIHDGFIARARSQIDADRYDAEWFEERTMTLEETIEYALAIA